MEDVLRTFARYCRNKVDMDVFDDLFNVQEDDWVSDWVS